MARIRRIEIENFRSIRKLDWYPSEGINCLIGPGDSGKSTILDAIDLCLGARRNINFTDADFYGLDVDQDMRITLTIGTLTDVLKNIESYGLYLRGYIAETGEIEDEPEKDGETVLCLRLTVRSDLEPEWSLISDRAAAQDASRNLSWADRTRLAPTRLGAASEYNLGWRRGSVLNQLSEERADASGALAKAARNAREAFDDDAQDQLGETLGIVQATAADLGVQVGETVKAMLDTHSVNFSGGAISLHNSDGIPLRGLGTGSTRLLIAGLQRKAAERTSIVLVDEIEHGLEPHRIIRLLGSLGAKEKVPPLQVFATTHAPAVLRELSGEQLIVIRETGENHHARVIGSDSDIQGTIRSQPEAFLAPSVLVCEGASEVGFVRGLDQYRVSNDKPSIAACGVAIVDAGGVSKIYSRALPLQKAGYRVATLRDDDKKPDTAQEGQFSSSGVVFKWRDGKAIEDEIFACVSEKAVGELLNYAIALHGEELVASHILSVSKNSIALHDIESAGLNAGYTSAHRQLLAKSSSTKSNPWFKSVTSMEKSGVRLSAQNSGTVSTYSASQWPRYSNGRSMLNESVDLLAIKRGTVTAPAGCGKTQLIADALVRHTGLKPILVLTHTNAGVVALRGRLDRTGVEKSSYRLSTLDGWAMRLLKTFPGRAGHNPSVLELNNPRADYPAIRAAACTLLHERHINEILTASYDRLIVDEYQDCNLAQHAMVVAAAKALVTCVLGDPMQAIFNFAGELVNWDKHVLAQFPAAGELNTPWRWKNAGAGRLGGWLLDVRRSLIAGEKFDLRAAPEEVSYVQLDGTKDMQRQLAAASAKSPVASGGVLIIGNSKSPRSQRDFAARIPGAVAVENVDLSDFVEFARAFDFGAGDAFVRLAEFAGMIMTNVGVPNLIVRVEALHKGTARKGPSEVEQKALAFYNCPSHQAAIDLLVTISAEGGTRTHRPAVMRACTKALRLSDGTEGISFYEAAIQIREQNRLLGREVPRRAVGSTLLLKGLEADVAVILNAADHEPRHLYVAMTRGARRLVVCARKPIIG